VGVVEEEEPLSVARFAMRLGGQGADVGVGGGGECEQNKK
jgi:hypothetical protein